jgi:hypothetical protein
LTLLLSIAWSSDAQLMHRSPPATEAVLFITLSSETYRRSALIGPLSGRDPQTALDFAFLCSTNVRVTIERFCEHSPSFQRNEKRRIGLSQITDQSTDKDWWVILIIFD